MPKFLYVAEVGHVYPDWPGPDGALGVEGIPGGDPVEMDAAPDGRWAEVLPEKATEKPKKSIKAAGESPAEKEH